MSDAPYRVTVVMTHPVQYLDPWFRSISATSEEIKLTVLYAAVPTPEAQGGGFDQPFVWDVSLLNGYDARVLMTEPTAEAIHADHFLDLDSPLLERALIDSAPDAVLVPGWHAALYRRAVRICHARRIPLLYRGDTNLLSARQGWIHPLWRLRTRQRLHEYDAWLAVGRASREYLATFRVPEPLVFNSPHCVENERFAESSAAHRPPVAHAALRRTLGLDPQAYVVLFAGKLVQHKRPLDAIRAVARLGPGVQLLMVGTGALEDECRREAKALNFDVIFTGFLNQSQMPRAYAAADCLVVPSALETWGLVVNEAFASGVPAVVSDRVGCGADLVEVDRTGEIAPLGDVAAFAGALARVRDRSATGHDFGAACRARVAAYSFRAATDGLLAACRRLRRRREAGVANASGAIRVLACCGGMVISGGLERMTFEVLGTMRTHGAAVHVIVNTWESSPIVSLAERIDASWSLGYYWQMLSRQLRPAVVVRMWWEAARTSAGLLRDAHRFKPTHIFLPDFVTVLRNAPALWWLRLRGATVILRLGNAPTVDALHRKVWRLLIAPIVDRFVPISRFVAGELAQHGIDPARVSVVYNTPSTRASVHEPVPFDAWRVVYVGQVIPPKGLDVLLEAVAQLIGAGCPVNLEVLGAVDGWESASYEGYRARLRARAAQPDLAGHVTFLGHREDVPARLAAAAVHCCPSQPDQREGLGSVVLEAKQAGVPSVVTASGGLPELVQHRVDGWITRDFSVDALSEGLAHFLRDPERRRQAAVAARASASTFSRERFTRGWLSVFGLSPATAPAEQQAREPRAS